MGLEGVQGVQETRFWTLCTKYYVGGVKLEVSANCDAKYVVSHTQMIFRSVGVTQLYVQLDYEHNRATYQNLQNFAYWPPFCFKTTVEHETQNGWPDVDDF